VAFFVRARTNTAAVVLDNVNLGVNGVTDLCNYSVYFNLTRGNLSLGGSARKDSAIRKEFLQSHARTSFVLSKMKLFSSL
jgi:hypothetical protein